MPKCATDSKRYPSISKRIIDLKKRKKKGSFTKADKGLLMSI
jgi:hypothetical protein